MVLLGISTMGSSAASIFINDKCIAAVEEERLTRVKNDGSFPIESIKECLKISNLEFDDIDEINVYWKPFKVKNRFLGVINKFFSSKRSRINIVKKVFFHFNNKSKDINYVENSGKWLDLFFIKSILNKNFKKSNYKINYYDHHQTHQLYAESIKKWNNSVILSYDGGGEEFSTVINVRNNGKSSRIKEYSWPNSLGHFYSFFTGYLGFRMQEGEYKMMGLAPYGKPIYEDIIFDKIITLKPNGGYKINYDFCDYHSALNGEFNIELEKFFPKFLKRGERPSDQHINLASSVQSVFEKVQVHILKNIKNKFKNINKLVITGGCGLNVTANGKVLDANLFEEVIVPPAPHDAGCAIGSNLANLISKGKKINENYHTQTPYLGAEYSDKEIGNQFSSLKLIQPKKLKSYSEIIDHASENLRNGSVIAWFQGRSEFGPRALGSRSFLADPRNDNIREEINRKIKKRELFRPFAPSTLDNKAKVYFDLDQGSPYMNMVAKVKKNKRKIIPAVTHIDGTARVHTVSRLSNKLYYDLIESFGKKTGVYVLLNTSFNIQEPIVYDPKNAIETFLNSGVDYLYIGKFVCDNKWRLNVLK